MMFKRFGVLIILVVLALMSSVSAVSALGEISDTGVIFVDPLLFVPVQAPIPDIGLPAAQPAQSTPAAPAQGGSPPGQTQPRGRSLATGSIWVQLDGREININFNARQENDTGDASGHIFWREDGQTTRVNVEQLFFMSNQAEGWTCAFMGGTVYRGPEGRHNMCFAICDDYDIAARWNYSDVWDLNWVMFDAHRGNLTIKP